jgi:hypothetical protein
VCADCPLTIPIQGHEGPQFVARDASLLHHRGQEVQPILSPFAGAPRRRGCAGYQAHLVENAIAWASVNQTVIAWASVNQTVSALRFLYGVTLGRKDLPERIATEGTRRARGRARFCSPRSALRADGR